MSLCANGLPSQFTFFSGSGQFLYWYLSDPTTAPATPIATSSITATLYAGRDINNPTMTPGTPVASFTDVVLTSVPSCAGKYQVLIPATFNPTLGSGYVLVVDAITSGYEDMEWSIPAIVQAGTVVVPERKLVVSAQQFRCDFPEFSDPLAYPNSQICFWMAAASLFLNPCFWYDALCLGAELYTAHMLVLEKQARDTAKVGGWPGFSKGAVSSENPGDVTVSYDTAITLIDGAGHWNLSVFGTRFLYFARMMGAGEFQIGAGCGFAAGAVPGVYNGNNGAYSGPPTLPGLLG